PEENMMPQANVVGVEVGSLVRVDPMSAPGKVYVIAERYVRANPGESHPRTCGELVAEPGSPQWNIDHSLVLNNNYHVATVVDQALGQSKVSVLAITGCGSQADLDLIGLSNTSCGADWNTTNGNLKAKVVDLPTSNNWATETTLPVQLFQMSQAIDAFKGNGT